MRPGLDARIVSGHTVAMRGPTVRVLHAVSSLGLGGTQKAMQLMVSHLDRSRFEPFVYSSQDGERRQQLKDAGIAVIVGGELLPLLEKLKPDIVHIHRAGWPEAQLLGPVKRYGPKAVVETNVFGRDDPTILGRRVDMHLMVSRFCLERFAKDHGAQAKMERYRVLYNPVDTDLFARLCPDADVARPVAARLSRPDPGKWSGLVSAMLPIVAARRPDFHFLVVGATPGFMEFVAANGLADHVECLPQIACDSGLAAFFQRASLLAHANDTGESFGMAIAEAMAAGLPVVTHPAQGARDNAQLELVEHGVTGLVAHNAQEYAQAMLWLWEHPEEARRMGQAGRGKAQRLYRAQEIARQLQALYEELLAS